MLNKKAAEDVLLGTVIFVIANVAFISIVMGGVKITTDSSTVFEESYSKQIALLINNAKPGTEIELNINELTQLARRNNAELQIELNCDSSEVFVKASREGGYRFNYFTNLEECNFNLNKEERRFTINV